MFQKSLTLEDLSPSIVDRFWSKVDKSGDCWLWTAYTNIRGYGVFNVNKKLGLFLTHRVSYLLHKQVLTHDMNVCHICDNTSCVHPSHLQEATQSWNLTDAYDKGRRSTRKGTDNILSRLLSNSDITKIFELYSEGNTQLEISTRYNVSRQHISNILLGKRRSFRDF